MEFSLSSQPKERSSFEKHKLAFKKKPQQFSINQKKNIEKNYVYVHVIKYKI